MRLNAFTQLHLKGQLFFGYPVGERNDEIIFKCTNGDEYRLKKKNILRYFQNG